MITRIKHESNKTKETKMNNTKASRAKNFNEEHGSLKRFSVDHVILPAVKSYFKRRHLLSNAI